jgi:type IV secretory pathway TrbD component
MAEPAKPRSPSLLIGAAAGGSLLVLFLGVPAIIVFFFLNEWTAFGIALLAVGATSGLVLNAVLRQ